MQTLPRDLQRALAFNVGAAAMTADNYVRGHDALVGATIDAHLQCIRRRGAPAPANDASATVLRRTAAAYTPTGHAGELGAYPLNWAVHAPTFCAHVPLDDHTLDAPTTQPLERRIMREITARSDTGAFGDGAPRGVYGSIMHELVQTK